VEPWVSPPAPSTPPETDGWNPPGWARFTTIVCFAGGILSGSVNLAIWHDPLGYLWAFSLVLIGIGMRAAGVRVFSRR
jgi:fatty acid desaturase